MGIPGLDGLATTDNERDGLCAVRVLFSNVGPGRVNESSVCRGIPAHEDLVIDPGVARLTTILVETIEHLFSAQVSFAAALALIAASVPAIVYALIR